MTHYTNTNNPIDFPKKKEIPMLERFAAQSLVDHGGELIFSKEKFAELIIGHATECVRDVLRDENSDLTYTAASQVQNRIKEHFGVKECYLPVA